ncbi:polysaccharide biosynthesis C-terminal domain-containing protein [Cetobacterium somerae]|uniref:lipopolysaccharide biosynthesis protein n=1 Tax=Cetobacterium somerae TaxID=188913 RepID=UPI0022520D46|nr:polysaccharide biosynthesis C-terminal domain-containing protein [Cetobacterium somerae]MCX3068150.1 polysaccharide biosynthesis C-terminal domain-containing protein [Cetobacterium somerae]
MYKKIKVYKQLSKGIILQVITLVLMYLTTPLLIKYFGMELYGVWISIFSALNWIYMFDLGVGNEIKNKLIETRVKDKGKYIEEIFDGYSFFLKMGILLFSLGLLLLYFFRDQNFIFEYFDLLVLVLILTVINFIISFYKILYASSHDLLTDKLAQLLHQIIFLSILILLIKLKYKSIKFLSIVNISILILIGIFFSIKYLKKLDLKKIKINFKSNVYSKKSFQFFLIQISMLIILSTDNIIIAKYSNFEEVSNYNIISKLYQPYIIVISYILSQYWSLFSEAYIQRDYIWINKTVIKLTKKSFILIPILFIYSILVPYIIKIWIGKDINISTMIRIMFSIYIYLTAFSGIYMSFLNSINEIRLQMYLYLFGAIINIPLSIYLLKKMGIEGVILGTNLSLVMLFLILPIQVKKIIKKKESKYV